MLTRTVKTKVLVYNIIVSYYVDTYTHARVLLLLFLILFFDECEFVKQEFV